MYYKNIDHCLRSLEKLFKKYDIPFKKQDELITLSSLFYKIETSKEESYFKHSITGNLYWEVKNDLEDDKLKETLEYLKILEKLKANPIKEK